MKLKIYDRKYAPFKIFLKKLSMHKHFTKNKMPYTKIFFVEKRKFSIEDISVQKIFYKKKVLYKIFIRKKPYLYKTILFYSKKINFQSKYLYIFSIERSLMQNIFHFL